MHRARSLRPSPHAIALSCAAGLALALLIWQREMSGQCSNPGPLRSVWTSIEGIRIHCRTSSAPVPRGRPPVILVHGLGMSSRYMVPLAQCLGQHIQVFAPDLPGFGLSDKPERFFTVAEQAAALAAWMDSVGLVRAAFVGNSLGCEILVEFALRYPERVSAVVLQGPTPDPEALDPVHQIPLFFLTGLFERPSLAWVALTEYLRSGVRRYVWTFRDMVAHRIEGKLPYVPAPALVIWGTRDFLVPRASVERVAALLPAGRLAVIEGAAHGMNYSHPRLLAECVLNVLAGESEAAR